MSLRSGRGEDSGITAKMSQVIKAENRTHLERSELLGAFREGELIGFLKMVYVGTAAYVMQIVAKNVHCRQETNERSDREGR